MTLESFKQHLLSKQNGEFQIPDTNELIAVGLQEALEAISNMPNVIPLFLVTSDKSQEVLRPINAHDFVRVPVAPKLDSDDIDIDKGLCYAVLYEYLGTLATDINLYKFYEMKRDQIISNYIWNNFNTLQELGVV